MRKPTASQYFWLYLAVLGLACSGLARYTTAALGPGVGTDGAIQVSTATNLLAGRGFVDYAGDPYLRWPPLYPVTLATLSLMTGLDTFSIAWYLNLALFGVIVWLAGAVLYACFPDAPLWAYTGTLALAASKSILVVCATLGTDPMFMALALGWVLAASRYLSTRSSPALAGMALLACLASLQRLPGIALIAAGAILILYANRELLWSGMRIALPYAILTVLPLVLWAVLYSYLQHHSFFGVAFLQATDPRINFIDSLRKIAYWFIPRSLIRYSWAILLTALLAVLLPTIGRSKAWQPLGSRLLRPAVLSSLIFAALYYAFLIFTINSIDTVYDYYDRYYIVLMPPVLVLIFAGLQDMLLPRFASHLVLSRLVVVVLAAVWLVFPVFSSYKLVGNARQEGVPYYNKYNTRAMRELPVVEVLRQIGSQGDVPVYSNYPAAAWFFLRREALASPRGAITSDVSMDELEQRYQGWPGEQPGYLVWFLPNEYDHVLDLRHLDDLARLTPVYIGKDGRVFKVQARPK